MDTEKMREAALYVAMHRDLVPTEILRRHREVADLSLAPKAELTVSALGFDGFAVFDANEAIVKRFPRTAAGNFAEETRDLNIAANRYADESGKVWESFGGANRFDPHTKRWYSARVHGDAIPIDGECLCRRESSAIPIV